MDFDKDGKRDIGVWYPPTKIGDDGEFKILLSTTGFSTGPDKNMSVRHGQAGDTPLVADFSGDGVTDVAVFQPGGGFNRKDPLDTQAYWRWCPTDASNPLGTSCASPVVMAFGERGDIPLPGLCFSTPCRPYLTIFRPRTGEWMWRLAIEGSAIVTRKLGGPRSVLLPGLYDPDSLTDLAVFEPDTAEAKLLRSNDVWTTPIVRQFGSRFRAQSTGSELNRSAPITLSGVTRRSYSGARTLGSDSFVPRRVFSLYLPQDGSWNTMWDPINSDRVQTCYTDNGETDIPMPGLDENGDYVSDMAFLRATSGSDDGYLHISSFSLSDLGSRQVGAPRKCPEVERILDWLPWNWAKVRAFVVADMTGDGLKEILFFDPDEMVVAWLRSEDWWGGEGVQRLLGPRRGTLL